MPCDAVNFSVGCYRYCVSRVTVIEGVFSVELFFSNVFSVYRILTYTVELLVLALSSDYTRYHSYRIVSYLQLPVWRLPASFVSKFILVSFYPILLFKSIVLLSPDFLRTLDYYYCPTSLYLEGFPSYFLGSKCQHSRVEQVRPAILFLRRYWLWRNVSDSNQSQAQWTQVITDKSTYFRNRN